MVGIILGRSGPLTATGTRFLGISTNPAMPGAASEIFISQPMPGSGSVQNFYISLSAAPGLGTKYNVTVLKNGTATAMTFDIADTATTGQDTINTVSYVQGDRISLQFIPTGTPATPTATWSIENVGTGYPVLSGSNGVINTATPQYLSFQCSSWNTTNAGIDTLLPTDGVVSNLQLLGNANVGVGNTITVTLVKNGIDTALVASFTGANSTASDTIDTLSVTATDLLYYRLDYLGTPVTTRVLVGALFTPTADGESIQTASTFATTSTTTTVYLGVGGSNNTSSNTENARNNTLGSAGVVVEKLSLSTSPAPGTGKSYTATLRSNQADTAVTCTISNTATSARDTSNAAAHVAGGFLDVSITPTGTPTAAVPKVSYVTFVSTDSNVPVSDTLTTTESVGYYSDLIATRESYQVVVGASVSKSDTLTTTESIQLLITGSTAVSNTLTTTESVTVKIVVGITQSDSLTLTESVQLVLISRVSTNDNLTFTENTQVKIVVALSVTASDNLTLSESVQLLVIPAQVPIGIILNSNANTDTMMSGTNIAVLSSGANTDTLASGTNQTTVETASNTVTLNSQDNDVTLGK